MNKLLSILFLFLLAESFAQNKPVLVETEDKVAIKSSSVAINPKDPSNIVITTAFNRVFHSMDSGRTWRDVLVQHSEGVYGDHSLQVDEKGKYVLIGNSKQADSNWQESKFDGPLSVFISGDKGMTWENETTIPGTEEYMTFGSVVTHSPEAGGISTLWFQHGNQNSSLRIPGIYGSYSSSGNKWSKPGSLIHAPPEEVPEVFPYKHLSASMGPNGQVYVVWLKDNTIYLDRSYDKAKMWLRRDIPIGSVLNNANVQLGSHTIGALSTAVDNSRSVFSGTIYVAWADTRKNDADSEVLLLKSGNRGDSWNSTPVLISSTGEGKHDIDPILSIDQSNGVLFGLHLQLVDDEKADLIMSWSLDGGSSFSTRKVNSEPFVPMFDRKNHDIAAESGVICPIWLENANGEIRLMSATFTYSDLGVK